MSDTFNNSENNIESNFKEKPKRVRMQKYRIIALITVLLLIALHMITWYLLDIRILGNIGIESFFYGLAYGIVTFGLVYWIVALLSVVLVGRVYCGWICFFGDYVELAGMGLKKSKSRLPRRAILYLSAIALTGLIVQIYMLVIKPWLASGIPDAFTIQLNTPEAWRGGQTLLSSIIVLILYGPVLIYIFGERAWCRYLCPIGALFKVCSVVRPGKIRLVNNDCIGCGACNRNCDMQIDVMGELKKFGEIRSLDCICCFKCTDNCPKKSIKFTFKKTNYSISDQITPKIEQISSERRKYSGFDLIIASIWICFTVLFTIVSLNQNQPLELKAAMGSLLLLVIYGIVWRIYKGKKEKQKNNTKK